MNGNFFQLKGTFGGFNPTLTAGTAPVTFSFDLKGFPAKLGNDWIYADRIRFRMKGPIHLAANTAEGVSALAPNRQQMASVVRQCRVYSPVLGELSPRAMTYGTYLNNHDSWYDRRFQEHSREQYRSAQTLAATNVDTFTDFEINFQRDYLISEDDTTPLLALLEGGVLEIDLAPFTAIPNGPQQLDWEMSQTANAWSCNATVDYHHDSQLYIHTPAQRRLYQRQLAAPAFELQNVGAPQGLEGVASGCRLATLSWMGAGYDDGEDLPVDPFNFYVNAPPSPASGVNFAQQGLQRMDIPWRDQRSITDVQAWLHSFQTDARPRPTRQQYGNAGTLAGTYALMDVGGWPNQEDTDPVFAAGDPLLNPLIGFMPIVWPGKDGNKIADMQMVDGTLTYNADFSSQPGTLTHRYRTDEICQFTEQKVRELMALLKCPHVSDGGEFVLVPKYDGARLGSERTAAFLPQKIVHKSAVG